MFNELGPIDRANLGDMPGEEFQKYAHDLINWAHDYFESIESYPVLGKTAPGEIRDALPQEAPEKGENFDNILQDFKKIIIPGVTHWNHPNFFAYFSITGSVPGIFGDFLSTVLNINGMLWKTCPSATELEETVIEWAKKLLGIPQEFFGMIVDTASIATLHALTAAREQCSDLNIRVKGYSRGVDAPQLCMYCSEHAHSSIDKAAIVLGIGLENVCKIEADDEYRMRSDILEQRITADIQKGRRPFAVAATLGTTSTTSIDPIREIGEVCRRYNLWLHVDGAYAGSASIIPEYEEIMDGFEYVDSYVTNPHKWLFTPFDASLFFVRDEAILKRAFSIIPEYLTTAESKDVTDFMNYGTQLGRRFRALKLWFVMRYYGREGIINRLREHIRLARLLQSFIKESEDFELTAPVPFSVVCFRYNPRNKNLDEPELEALNTRLMDAVNATGKMYISHTRLKEKYTLRFAIGNIRTTETHIRNAWRVLCDCVKNL